MLFDPPLVPGTLLQRYKRFLADVRLADGEVVVAHCANSGSMLSVREPGSPVWLTRVDDPKRKLKYTWELIEIGGALAGINTAHPNRLVADAVSAGAVPELTGYASLRREVKYGKNSRIDILLEGPDKPPCYVEVKNVTLMRRAGLAEFPDAVTTRGAKHLEELGDMVAQGHRAVMFYLVQRTDCQAFTLAADIDPAYAAGLKIALERGVEAVCYTCDISRYGIAVSTPLPIET